MADDIEQYINAKRRGDLDHLYIANLPAHDYALVVLQPVGGYFFVKMFNPGYPKSHDIGLNPDYQESFLTLDAAKADFIRQVNKILAQPATNARVISGPPKPPLHPQPLQYADCYSLNLYCDHFASADGWHAHGSQPAQYTGNSFAECARQARRAGWVIHRATRTATCPKCSKANK